MCAHLFIQQRGDAHGRRRVGLAGAGGADVFFLFGFFFFFYRQTRLTFEGPGRGAGLTVWGPDLAEVAALPEAPGAPRHFRSFADYAKVGCWRSADCCEDVAFADEGS